MTTHVMQIQHVYRNEVPAIPSWLPHGYTLLLSMFRLLAYHGCQKIVKVEDSIHSSLLNVKHKFLFQGDKNYLLTQKGKV